MIKLNLEHLMKLRDVNHPQSFLSRHGFTRHESRTLLNGNMQMLRLKHMTKLCELFKCLPSELFTWEGDSSSNLAALKRQPIKEMAQLLAGRTPHEIEEIYRKLGNGEI